MFLYHLNFVEQKNIADENSTENINGTTETEKKIVEKKAGEKLYLTQSEIDNNFAEINVEYDTVMQDSKTLYNKKLIFTFCVSNPTFFFNKGFFKII